MGRIQNLPWPAKEWDGPGWGSGAMNGWVFKEHPLPPSLVPGCRGARPAGGRVGAAAAPLGAALPARGREELRADGRVKIGQSCAELLLQGRGVKCLFSHFTLCLGKSCGVPALRWHSQRERARQRLPRVFDIISTCLKEKSAQMSKQTNKASNNGRAQPRAPFSISQDD